MNIKSLLFGSAAALVAVSGARAADAVVVAEPEPAEYVRICDVYGAGYFYIPGTETCLRIGGYLRYDIGIGDGVLRGRQAVDHLDGDINDTYSKRARFALKTWTGQETELGTLKTYTETRFDFNNGGPGTNVNLAYAWVQLGGLRIGRDDSLSNEFTPAGNVDFDDIVPYGSSDQTNAIKYYFDAGNGFSAAVSLEEGYADSYGHDYTLDSYVPHVVLGAKYTQGWGGLAGTIAYDSVHEEWAGKVRLDVKATEQLSLFVMGGYGSDDETLEGYNYYKPWDGNWAVWGGGTYQINERTQTNLALSYDEGKNLGVAANVAYDLVPGFTVMAEVDYWNHTKDNEWGPKDDALGGLIRFQRNF